MSTQEPLTSGPFFHGTRADLRVGDLIVPGFRSNYTMKMFWRSSMPVERVRTLFSWKP